MSITQQQQPEIIASVGLFEGIEPGAAGDEFAEPGSGVELRFVSGAWEVVMRWPVLATAGPVEMQIKAAPGAAPEEIEQGCLDRGSGMDRCAEVESLRAAPPGVAVGEVLLHGIDDAIASGNRLSDHHWARVFNRLPDLLAPGNLADACVARAVLEDHDIAREERTMGAAQVEQHAVEPRDRDHGHFGDGRSGFAHDDFLLQHTCGQAPANWGAVSHSGSGLRVLYMEEEICNRNVRRRSLWIAPTAGASTCLETT
jgi:hypothetical protein